MKPSPLFLAAALLLLGMHCSSPDIKQQQVSEPTQPSKAEPQINPVVYTSEAHEPSDLQMVEGVHPPHILPAEVQQKFILVSPLDLTARELNAELQLLKEIDPIKRATIEAEITSLRAQRESFYHSKCEE